MTFEKTVYTFLKELGRFDCDVSCADLVWNVIFPDRKGQWNHLHVVKYRETFYVGHVDGDSCALEVVPNKSVQAMESSGFFGHEFGHDDPAATWAALIAHAGSWLVTVSKDWIRANRRVNELYPLNRRFGIVPNSLIRASLKDIYRVDTELGKRKSRKFIRLVEEGFFLKQENTLAESMTANDYFDYCRIAYIAAKRKDEDVDESLSGRDMYRRYADGRHEGLLDIAGDSKQEFSDWIDCKHPKRIGGGHPWEIKRGGNTTHIDLSVSRPSVYIKEGFKVELRGPAITRLKETLQMFLAIHDTSRAISIADPEGTRKRLLAQDNIGIIPSYASLHRANQHFKADECVYDVLHYDELGRYKRRVNPFITWEPLPVLKPKDIQ